MDCIEEDLKLKGFEVTDAEDRELWRRTIRTGNPEGEASRRRRKKNKKKKKNKWSNLCFEQQKELAGRDIS